MIGRVEIDVGTLDSAYIGEGFLAEVPANSPTMRWTTGNADVRLLRL